MELFKYIRDTPLDNSYMPNKKFIWPAVIAGAAALGSAAINFFSNKKSNTANKEINQSQISYAREAFEKEKDYNNWLLGNQRQLQMSDSKAAGQNPAFVNGSALGGVSNPVKQDVPNQIPMNYSFDTQPLGNVGFNALQYYLQSKQTEANVENLGADTQKKLSENDLLKIEKQYLPAMRQGQIDIMESTIAVNGSHIKLNDANCKVLAQTVLQKKAEIENINAKTEEIKATTANIAADTKLKMIESIWKSDEMQATIANLQAGAHLSYTQSHDIIATRVLRLANLQADLEKKAAEILNISADTANKYLEGGVLQINGQQMKFDLNSDKYFKNLERISNLINTSVNTFATINQMFINNLGAINPLSGFMKGSSKAPVKTSPVDIPPAPYN